MAIEIIGRLQVVLPVQNINGKNGTITKQEFVIETMDQYPKKVCLEAWNDKVDILRTIQPGTQVTVSFNPESREYNGRWYTSLRAWKIDLSGGAAPHQSAPSPSNNSVPPFPTEAPPMPDGDLPF